MRIFAFADEASPSIDLQIAAMKRNGLQGLEIRNVDGENVSNISLEKAKEVLGKMKDAGLVVWSIGSPIGKIDIEKDDYPAHLEKLRHTIEIAQALESENIRLFSFYIPKDKKPEDFRQQVIDRMGEMARIAEGSGVTLCHENEKGIYGDNAARCAEILATVPQLAGIFDPANFIQCGQETLSAWEMLAPRIRYLHIKDATAEGHVVPAGNGIGNLRRIVPEFIKNGGDAATIEPHLTVFKGLEALEKDQKTEIPAFQYESSDAAFDAACGAFKEILRESGESVK